MFINSKYQTQKDLNAAVGISVLALFMIGFTSFILKFNKNQLDSQQFREKWSNLYSDIHLTRNSWTIWYYPIFLIRRFIFVLLPTVFYNWPYLQL